MKIAIGSRPYDGPWGGGNRFVGSLCEALVATGHQVVHELTDHDIDIILIIDPRWRSPNVCFGPGAILRYLLLRNRNAIVVHRINECDERKGEKFINAKLARANYVADATVFVGEWLTRLPIWRTALRPPWFVIRNGADTRVFNSAGFQPWPGQGPVKLVTHHWGYHPMKGFDIYTLLDGMLAESDWRNRISFTYIGNLPHGFTFKNATYVRPLDGMALATELKRHHAYVTGSINEPGGNHQNEGALCGLPLLYRRSGCMPEYCDGFGVPFEGTSDFMPALRQMIERYSALAARMPNYPHTAAAMASKWIALFARLVAERGAIVERRRLGREPLRALATQLGL